MVKKVSERKTNRYYESVSEKDCKDIFTRATNVFNEAGDVFVKLAKRSTSIDYRHSDSSYGNTLVKMEDCIRDLSMSIDNFMDILKDERLFDHKHFVDMYADRLSGDTEKMISAINKAQKFI